MQRLVDGPEVPLGHGVGQHLGGAGVALESEQRIVAAGARAPEPETVTAHQRGHGGGVEQTGVGGRVLQVPVHVLAQAGNTVDADVGQGLVPADLLVDLGPQTQRAGHGRGGGRGIGVWVPADEVRPDSHQFASAEVLPIRDGIGDRLAMPLAASTSVSSTALFSGKALASASSAVHTIPTTAVATVRMGRVPSLISTTRTPWC